MQQLQLFYLELTRTLTSCRRLNVSCSCTLYTTEHQKLLDLFPVLFCFAY